LYKWKNIYQERTIQKGVEALFVVRIVNDVNASLWSAEHVQAKSFAILVLAAYGLASGDQGASTAITQKSIAETKLNTVKILVLRRAHNYLLQMRHSYRVGVIYEAQASDRSLLVIDDLVITSPYN